MVRLVKIIAHHDNPKRAAELFVEEKVAAIGYFRSGSIADKSDVEVRQMLIKEGNERPGFSLTILMRFRDEIAEGDIVLAYAMNNTVALIGEVVGKYRFNNTNKVGLPDSKGGEIDYPNQIEVRWWKKPRNFHRNLLPENIRKAIADRHAVRIIESDFDVNKFADALRNKGLDVDLAEEKREFWIELTRVRGYPDREQGIYSLGRALWSPQEDQGGKDIYKNMRLVKKNDTVLHLNLSNGNIVGASVVSKECDTNFFCLPGTPWDDGTGRRPGYLIELGSYQALDSPLGKEEILNNENKVKLFKMLSEHRNLFYNRRLDFNQGTYLTRLPPELAALINDVYKRKTNKSLPYLEGIDVKSQASPEIPHLLYKIAWHPRGYKGGFCGSSQETACEAFAYVRRNKRMKPCSPDAFHCVDEHEAFADTGWKVRIHPPSYTKLHQLSDGESLVFLVAPRDKYKNRFRLVGFYTIGAKAIDEGKVVGLDADKERSSKFDLENPRLELDSKELLDLFETQRWTPRASYEIIPTATAAKVLKEIYELHKHKETADPDVNLLAMSSAVERLQPTQPAPQITLHEYLLSKRYLFQEPAVSAFYAAMKTKGLVILAGLTGTGKTKLPQLLFELVASQHGHRLFLSVRPDWRDSKPLVGYYNPIEPAYESTELLSQIQRACANWKSQQPKLPFFVLLDEMNLARVEYYFADFLSVLESGRDDHCLTKEPLRLHAMKNCKTRDEVEVESGINLSPNLYFAGTVNLDETTYSFSPKVLDRAFVVEFWDVNLEGYPPQVNLQTADASVQQLKGRILEDLSRNGKSLAYTKQDMELAITALGTHFEHIKKLNRILEDFGLHFGYRVADEIALFFHNATESMQKNIVRFESEDQIVDYAILMKVLPKIHGNRSKAEIPLRRMLAWAIAPENRTEILKELEEESGALRNEYLQMLPKGPIEFLSKTCGNRQAKYPKTAEKIARMIYQLYTTGFASFL